AGRQGDNPLGAAGDGDGAAGIVSEGVRVAGVGVGAGPGGTAVGTRRRGSAASAAGGRQQQRSSQGEDQQAVDTTNPGRGPGSGKDTHARYPLIREGDTPGSRAGLLASGSSPGPQPPFRPSHPARTVDGTGYPVTVAGPRRILTGFPILPGLLHRGTRDRRSSVVGPPVFYHFPAALRRSAGI